MMSLLKLRASAIDSAFYVGGRGLNIVISAAKMRCGGKFLLYGCSKDLWQILLDLYTL